ncbi:MAG: hypothetical protein VB108_01585 [Anaerolineaceae bacterium]|nr:hypothetical protein [Anaerolineaceae bacterium]
MSDQQIPEAPQQPQEPQPQYIPPYQPQAPNLDPSQTVYQQPQYQQPYQQPQYQQYQQPQGQFVPPSQGYYDPNLTPDDKTWGGLSYIPIVGLIVLFIQEKAARPFIKKQAVQSVTLAAVVILSTILVGWIPIIGWLFDFLAWIGFGVYSIINLINALNGKDVNIPVITDFVRRQGWIR